MKQSYPDIHILDRMTLVMNEVLSAPYGLSSAEISKRVKIPKTTLYRLLASMTKNGFLKLNPDSGIYSPGNRFTYSYYAISSNYTRLKRISRPYLEDLAIETKQSMKLDVLSRSSSISLSVIEGTKAVRIVLDEGSSFPLHASAGGKILMNSLGDADLDHYIRHHFEQYTNNTITDETELREELERVKRRGYATDFEEYLPDVCAVAGPIIDVNKNIIAAISVTFPAVEKDSMDTEKTAEQIDKTAKKIQNAMKTAIGHQETSIAVKRF